MRLNTKNLRVAILLIQTILLSGIAFSQSPGRTRSTVQDVVPSETVERLRAIYEENEFAVRSFRADWLPDGSGYMVLETAPGSNVQVLASYDVASGKRAELVSASQLAFPEATGPFFIESYTFSPDGNKILLSAVNREGENRTLSHWMLEMGSGKLQKVKAGRNNRISPDGRRILFSDQGNLCVYNLQNECTILLKNDAIPGSVTYGNEVWSPDGKRVAFVQSDVSAVKLRSMLVPGDPTYPEVRETRFARVGGTIASLRIGVVDAEGNETRWLPVPIPSEGYYLGQVSWAGNSNEVLVEKLSRFRDKREFFIANVNNGTITRIFDESDPAWVVASYGTNLGLEWINDYNTFLVLSEKDGWRHAYLCSRLKLLKHPTRTGKDEGAWYGDIWVTGNTSYLIMAEKSLVRLAEAAGDKEMAARRKPRIRKAVNAMRKYMWDEEAGTFLSVNRESMEKIPVATISSWVPLAAGVPTKKMARRMAEVLAGPSWQTPLPVPTVDRKDPRWKSNSFWRGDVWPSTNYQIASGLAAYGHSELAAIIADKTVTNAIENGISEHYDSVSGQPLGIRDYCMSSSIATMMLDGLTEQYVKENLQNSKPRMIYNDQIVKDLKDKIKTDPVIKNMYEAIRLDAYAILDTTMIKRIKTSNAMLDISRELLRGINMLGLVYLIEKDKTILERINQEVIAACQFSDWNPPVYLDVAEICMAISLALDWTLDDLPESTINEAKKALIEKGIYPSWEEHGGDMRNAWWIDHYNNWNQVCNGGMIAASIAIADIDPELAAKTIKRSLDGLPNVLCSYMPEGIYPESPMYWEYGTSYTVLTLSMLETAFGSDFGHKDYPGFIESATYKYMTSSLPSGAYYNFADCKDEPTVDGDIILAWFAAHTGKSIFYDKEKFLTPPEEIRISYLTGAALAWMSQYEERSDEEPPLSWVGRGKTPIAVFKGEGVKSDYYFAAKGGCGAVSHGNMDAGSFIFELNGVRWSIDPGIQSYMIGEQGFDLWSQCQDCERWELLTKNNHGHSTLTVNDERHIVDGYSTVLDFKTGKNPEVTFDLTPSLEGQLNSAFRKFKKDGDNGLLIEDEVVINEQTKYMTWQLITQAGVEIVDDGAILKQDGKELKLNNLSHPGIMLDVISLDPPPHKLDKVMENLKRIELKIPVSIIDRNNVLKISIELKRN